MTDEIPFTVIPISKIVEGEKFCASDAEIVREPKPFIESIFSKDKDNTILEVKYTVDGCYRELAAIMRTLANAVSETGVDITTGETVYSGRPFNRTAVTDYYRDS